MLNPSPQDDQHRRGRGEILPAEPQHSGDVLPQFIKAEANLLRLPLFALHTKGLKTLDGIECRGTSTRGREAHQFIFRITRNTALLYPGPLSRKIHFALLGIATERGVPLENPITFSWRDLARRMGIAYGGKTTLRHLKGAIRSTHGIVIHTQFALYDRKSGQALPARERGHHLYSDYAFVNDRLPDGTNADTNHVWFADWYLANLNALFSAPLDYELWRFLDDRSPIASRLYEFLLLNFYSGTPLLRINYTNLAQFLPVRPEKYLSAAKRQLRPAFNLVTQTGIIADAKWTKSKQGEPQVHLHRGKRLTAPADRDQPAFAFMEEHFTSAIEVKELRNLKPPEWGIVTDFYQLWADDRSHRPTAKELEQAKELIEAHGPAKAKAVIPIVVSIMKKRWPQAKTFGSIQSYVPDAAAAYDREQRQKEQRKQDRLRSQQEAAEAERHRQEEADFRAMWEPIWQQLPEAERQAIRAAVTEQHPILAGRKDSAFLHTFCLKELSRRTTGQGTGPASSPTSRETAPGPRP